MPIPVAVRSKAWVCGRSFAGVAGSNPTGSMDICLFRILCVMKVEISEMGRSLVSRSSTAPSVSECDFETSKNEEP